MTLFPLYSLCPGGSLIGCRQARDRPLPPLRTSRPPPFPQMTPPSPSRTYLPFGNCVVPQTTGGRHQSSAGHRSSRRESTFPILPYLAVRPTDAGSGQNPARRRRRRPTPQRNRPRGCDETSTRERRSRRHSTRSPQSTPPLRDPQQSLSPARGHRIHNLRVLRSSRLCPLRRLTA